jgi:hypothetical protein
MNLDGKESRGIDVIVMMLLVQEVTPLAVSTGKEVGMIFFLAGGQLGK